MGAVGVSPGETCIPVLILFGFEEEKASTSTWVTIECSPEAMPNYRLAVAFYFLWSFLCFDNSEHDQHFLQ